MGKKEIEFFPPMCGPIAPWTGRATKYTPTGYNPGRGTKYIEIPDDVVQEMIDYFEEGYAMREIGKILGYSVYKISKVFQKLEKDGIYTRPKEKLHHLTLKKKNKEGE